MVLLYLQSAWLSRPCLIAFDGRNIRSAGSGCFRRKTKGWLPIKSCTNVTYRGRNPDIEYWLYNANHEFISMTSQVLYQLRLSKHRSAFQGMKRATNRQSPYYPSIFRSIALDDQITAVTRHAKWLALVLINLVLFLTFLSSSCFRGCHNFWCTPTLWDLVCLRADYIVLFVSDPQNLRPLRESSNRLGLS